MSMLDLREKVGGRWGSAISVTDFIQQNRVLVPSLCASSRTPGSSVRAQNDSKPLIGATCLSSKPRTRPEQPSLGKSPHLPYVDFGLGWV